MNLLKGILKFIFYVGLKHFLNFFKDNHKVSRKQYYKDKKNLVDIFF